jgi:hypothetical protein
MKRSPEEMSHRERKGWGEALAVTEDLKELMRREKWRRGPVGAQPARTGRDFEPAVAGDSIDLYSILERTKHGIHP